MVPQGKWAQVLREMWFLEEYWFKTCFSSANEHMFPCQDGSQMNLACFPKETKETCFLRELRPVCFKQPHIIHKELGPFAMETMGNLGPFVLFSRRGLGKLG